jgi:hypothetical protein
VRQEFCGAGFRSQDSGFRKRRSRTGADHPLIPNPKSGAEGRIQESEVRNQVLLTPGFWLLAPAFSRLT